MPDTKISRTPQGWVDDDNPTTYYAVRRLARDARRGTTTTTTTTKKVKTKTVTFFGMKNNNTGQPAGNIVLDPLQQRLYDRLTNRQGVDINDAFDIVTTNGYNKAASYGHMREAGASHSEAEVVISLDSPDISLAYGIARARGYDHTDALAEAIHDS